MTVHDSEMEMSRAGIPEEIKDKQYTSERELLVDLEKFYLADLHILLNQDGFPIWREMPSDEHADVVSRIIHRFDEWKNGRSIKCNTRPIVYVNDSFNRPKNERRYPDLAIFGPDRFDEDGIRIVNADMMNPHVIIQFHWKNNNNVEQDPFAVDDIMHYAGMGEYIHLGRPTVAYLIKPVGCGTLPDSPLYGFDVFQVGQDQTTPEEPTMKYRCGVQEDTVISISPASMGLLDDEGAPFNIEMSHLRDALEDLNVRFVPALDGNEMS